MQPSETKEDKEVGLGQHPSPQQEQSLDSQIRKRVLQLMPQDRDPKESLTRITQQAQLELNTDTMVVEEKKT